MLNLTDNVEEVIDLDGTVNSRQRIYKIWLTGLYSRTAEFLLNQLVLKVHWLLQITNRNEQKNVFQFIPQAFGLKCKKSRAPNVDCIIKSKYIFAEYDFCFRQVTTKDKMGQIVIPLAEDGDDEDWLKNIYEEKLRDYFNSYFRAFPRRDCPEVTIEDVEDMRKLWRFLFDKDEAEDYSDLIGKPFNPFEAVQFVDFQRRLIKLNKDLLDCSYAELKDKGEEICASMEALFGEIDIFYAMKEKADADF